MFYDAFKHQTYLLVMGHMLQVYQYYSLWHCEYICLGRCRRAVARSVDEAVYLALDDLEKEPRYDRSACLKRQAIVEPITQPPPMSADERTARLLFDRRVSYAPNAPFDHDFEYGDQSPKYVSALHMLESLGYRINQEYVPRRGFVGKMGRNTAYRKLAYLGYAYSEQAVLWRKVERR